MPERLFMARLFLTVGGSLVIISPALWYLLGVPSMFPPYLVTGLLALGYGAVCRRRVPSEKS
ncbi:MAG: hypothetical protein LV480_06350 [Methylacidiphilales bacterium]|nr:hypothetical protein [Candidatus Methylacidiphilales bacterium]